MQSQSPSFMECSPTLRALMNAKWNKGVAVPINYGMLSYKTTDMFYLMFFVAVPIIYGMLSYTKGQWLDEAVLVAVPINYGMLSYLSYCKEYAAFTTSVAVPIIYGMLSYNFDATAQSYYHCRSPHHSWNALLPAKRHLTASSV